MKIKRCGSRKWQCILLAAIMAVGAFTGCSGKKVGDEIEVDPGKTQLRISYEDAGIGRAWITEVYEEFEERFKDYSFEEGKTGVQVIPDWNRLNGGDGLYDKMGAQDFDIYMSEGYNYRRFAIGENGKSKLLDISDVYAAPAVVGYENGQLVYEQGKGNLEDKLNDNMKDYLNVSSDATKHYCAVPFYVGNNGFICNPEWWNEYSLYFPKDEDSAPSEILAEAFADETTVDTNSQEFKTAKEQYETKLEEVKTNGVDIMVDENGDYVDPYNKETIHYGLSAGPDMKYGTSDDGQPATYDEFYLLCDYMVTQNVTPFIWGGANTPYWDKTVMELWRDYEGAENMEKYFNLRSGDTFDDIVEINNDGKIVKNPDGTPHLVSYTVDNRDGRDNGYLFQVQVGKYYALKFAEKIVGPEGENWASPRCYDNTSWLAAQGDFLTYGLTATDEDPIAMLVDGAWWAAEADSTFGIISGKTKFGDNPKDTMRFAFLHLPNATVEKCAARYNGQKDVIVHTNYSFFLPNGRILPGSGEEAATKMFLSFVNSDEMMNVFTKHTGVMRGLEYEITDEVYNTLNPWCKSQVDDAKECDIITPYTGNTFINNNYSDLKDAGNVRNYRAKTDFGEFMYAASSLHNPTNRAAGLNAETYLEGIMRFYKDRWENVLLKD